MQICLPVLVCEMIRSSDIKTMSFHIRASHSFPLIIVNLVIYFESDNFTNTGQLCSYATKSIFMLLWLMFSHERHILPVLIKYPLLPQTPMFSGWT